ncbi:MAG: hypothetical protein DMG83_27120 [Acidobacteria bacterium]|nr:MAG: hypothetical protein DMG83_27120 [Acidobacteriota bacterium]
MEITLENLRKFGLHYGELRIVDSRGTNRKLEDGTPDIWELAEKADRFWSEGRWYDRAEMERLLDRMEPANVSQIPLAELEHMETDPNFEEE